MLFSQANCLLLDEPTNHLDVWSRMTLESALQRFDGSLVIVSHDRYFLDRVTTKVVEILDGDVHQYPGRYSDYLRHLEERGESDGSRSGAPLSPTPARPTRAPDKPAAARPSASAKRDQEARLLAGVQDVAPRYPGRKTKEQRRREAEQRNQRGKALKPLQKRVKKIEDEIQLKEIRVNAINTELSRPETYDRPERMSELMRERKGIGEEIDRLTHEWESLLEEIEAHTRT
jgi:ATP-binding cassette subfamily F protein 3